MRKVFFGIILLLLAVAVVVWPLVVSAASPSIYESYNEGDGTADYVYGLLYSAQTFTTTEAHTVTDIRVKVYRVGSPGDLTAAIHDVDEAGDPTGSPLTAGTINANVITTGTSGVWYTVTVDELGLEAETQYAIVLSAQAGISTSHCVRWRYDATGEYADGSRYESVNGGVSWSAQAAHDYMFEIWGSSVVEMHQARVFASVQEDGDWLVTCLYTDNYPPYTETQLSRLWFALELVDGETIKASVKVPAWGYRPGAIYISASAATALQWGGDYDVRIRGLASKFDTPPEDSVTLAAMDWMGADITLLTEWCLQVAAEIEEAEDLTLTQDITGFQGKLLTDTGARIFQTGIPGLDQIAPNLFQYVITSMSHEDAEYTYAYQTSLEGNTGATLAERLSDFGGNFSLSGTQLGGFLFVGLYVVGVGVLYAVTRSGIASMAVPIPILIVGAVMGLISLSIIGVMGVLILFMLAYLIWWRTA